MNTKEAYKIVLKDMLKNGTGLFKGKFDAKNGNVHFMYGIHTVMEYIAHKAENKNFDNIFLKNLEKSIDKTKTL